MHTACVLCVFSTCAWFRDVTSFSDASGMVWVRVELVSVLTHQTYCSDSLLQTIPDASENVVTSRHQTHAPKNPTGRTPCAYSLESLTNCRLPAFSRWGVGRGGTGSGVPDSTPAGFCVFLSDPDPDPVSKICEKPDPDPESLFNFGSRSRLGHFLVKTWVNYGWNDDCSRSLNRSRIVKFEKLPDPDPDSKILEQERTRSLKKWLRPPLGVGSRFAPRVQIR